MSEFIAVEGLTLSDENPANTTTFVITATPKNKVKCVSKKVYAGGLDFQIAAGSGIAGTCLLTAPVSDTVAVTATKVKVQGDYVSRENDTVIVNANGVNPGTGASCPLVFQIKITDAGQTKVKAK